jgi:hypothetical protein
MATPSPGLVERAAPRKREPRAVNYPCFNPLISTLWCALAPIGTGTRAGMRAMGAASEAGRLAADMLAQQPATPDFVLAKRHCQ